MRSSLNKISDHMRKQLKSTYLFKISVNNIKSQNCKICRDFISADQRGNSGYVGRQGFTLSSNTIELCMRFYILYFIF